MERIASHKFLSSNGNAGDIAVPSAVTDVFSHSLKMDHGSAFVLSIRAKSSVGTPDIDLYIQQTHIDPTLASAGPEGDAGDVENGWARPNGSSKLLDILTENWYHITVSPLALPFIRLEFDPQGANPADCTVEAILSIQEDLN